MPPTANNPVPNSNIEFGSGVVEAIELCSFSEASATFVVPNIPDKLPEEYSAARLKA